MTVSDPANQREYALAALAFLKSPPSFGSELTVEKFTMLCKATNANSAGAKFAVALQHATSKLIIRKVIQDANIPFKDIFINYLSNLVRNISAHNFICNVLNVKEHSELAIYSKNRIAKEMGKLEQWASKPATHDQIPTATHAREAVAAMREMNELVNTVKVSLRAFNEEKIKSSATRTGGIIDYAVLAAQMRHNHTNYDALRVSRKIRHNTYWKLTAQPAVRIAVCEKLVLATKDPALHFYLMSEIRTTHTEFQKKLIKLAKAPNFDVAIDDVFAMTVKKKIAQRRKCDFTLCLQTL